MSGGAGNDSLDGGSGADTLIGDGGSDYMKLGSDADSDVVYWGAAADVGDMVSEFDPTLDSLSFLFSAFSFGYSGALNASDFKVIGAGTSFDGSNAAFGDAAAGFAWEVDTGTLYHDSNGDTAGGYASVATVDATLTAANINLAAAAP